MKRQRRLADGDLTGSESLDSSSERIPGPIREAAGRDAYSPRSARVRSRELKTAGYRDLSSRRPVEMRIHGVTPARLQLTAGQSANSSALFESEVFDLSIPNFASPPRISLATVSICRSRAAPGVVGDVLPMYHFSIQSLLRSVRFFSVLAALAAVCGSPAAFAQRAPELPVEQMSQRSETVVVGRVVSNRSRWVGKIIVTVSEVQVLDILKGEPAGDSFTLAWLGGRVGNFAQSVTHMEQLEEGELAVLFMSRMPPGAIVDAQARFAGGKITLSNRFDPERFTFDARLQAAIRDIGQRVMQGGGQ